MSSAARIWWGEGVVSLEVRVEVGKGKRVGMEEAVGELGEGKGGE